MGCAGVARWPLVSRGLEQMLLCCDAIRELARTHIFISSDRTPSSVKLKHKCCIFYFSSARLTGAAFDHVILYFWQGSGRLGVVTCGRSP